MRRLYPWMRAGPAAILGHAPPLKRQRWLMNAHNRRGIFDNASDYLERLRREHATRFEHVELETEGVALFAARHA